MVGEVVQARSDEEALHWLADPEFDMRKRAVVEDSALILPTEAAASREVRVTERTNDRVAVRAKLSHPGLLVISEGYYPGWRAAVDGVATPLVRANVMMRGVVLDAGEHEVEFHFRSRSIEVGAALSIATLALVAALRRRLVISEPRV